MDSLRRIRAAGFDAVGAGTDQPDALRAASFQIHGWTIAFLGIDQVLDPVDEVAGPDKPGSAAGHDFPLALRTVQDAALRGPRLRHDPLGRRARSAAEGGTRSRRPTG